MDEEPHVAVVRGSGNVFADLGFDNPEEELLKAQIVAHIRTLVEERSLSQVDTARLLKLKQPDVSKMLRGRVEGYSIERLLRFVRALGEDVTITVRQTNRHQEPGKLELLVA
jgi:predicted XRE-type DNA-binding protein